MTAEEKRLDEARTRQSHWRRWGSYLSERQWGTVQLTASFGRTNVAEMIPELMTLVTSQFLHGGFLHLGGNMLFLFIFGNNIEEQLGRIKYIIFHLACGALAGLACFLPENVKSNVLYKI